MARRSWFADTDPMRRAGGPLSVLVAVLALAPAAQAATLRADGTTKTISFTAGTGEANRVSVTQSGRAEQPAVAGSKGAAQRSPVGGRAGRS